jgi:thioredoxin-related protein
MTTVRIAPVLTAAAWVALALSPGAAEASAGAARSPAAGAIHWVESLEEALEVAKKHDELVLVDFYTDWCGWCKKLDRDVFSQDSFKKAASGIVAVKVNAEKHRPLADRFGATSYPRLFFLSSEGHTIDQVRGYLNLDPFTAKVQQVKSGDTEYDRARAAAGDPNNLEAVRHFARFLGDTQRLEDAIPYWQQVHDLTLQGLFQNPAAQAFALYHREALLELGRGYLAVGLADVGRQRLEEAVVSYPGTPESTRALVLLADLATQAGDAARARSLLQKAVDEGARFPAARDAAARLRRLDVSAAR